MLLLDAWLGAAPPPHRLVGTFRHPMAVARSLLARNAIPIAEGIGLWQDYNTRLIKKHEQMQFPLIEYSLGDAENYCKRVVKLAVALGLKPNFNKIRIFISSELDHHALADEVVPAECQAIYAYLRENAW